MFLLFSFFVVPLAAQNHRFSFTDTPLSKALAEVARERNILISFDSGVLETKLVTASFDEENVERALSLLLKNTGFTFELKYNTYLIVPAKPGQKEPVKKDVTVSGIVFDSETGERLPYASINLWNQNIAVSTTVEGTFSLRLTDSIQNLVEVRYMGYQSVDTIIDTSVPSAFLRIGMTRKMQNIQTVDIAGNKMEMVDFSKEAGRVVFNPSRFSDLPNYGETDVFRALQLMPGISSFENSSQLNVRGGTADQNLVLLDGFTLYNLDHFFGVFSALNPNVIKNIQVYRGGFDSRYGERISAIVDIVGKSGNQSQASYYGGINLISANLTAEIPISKKLTLVAAGRRAYSDMYSSWLADELLGDKLGQNRRLPAPDANVLTPEFYFSDYNLKLSHQISDQENISFSVYGSKDYLNSSSSNSNERGEFEAEDINEWGNYGLGTTWNKQWNGRYFTSLQFGHSGYFNDYNNNTTITVSNPTNPSDSTFIQDRELNEVTNESNRLTDYFLTFRNEYNINSHHKIEFGISGKYNRFTFYKDASRAVVYDNLESSAFLYTGFLQDQLKIGNRLALKPGMRMNYYSNSKKFYFEPRLTGNYSMADGLTLKFATGKYYQFLNKSGTEQNFGYNRDFWILADGGVNPVLSSSHYILGAGFEKNEFYIDVEAYYKTVNGLQEYLFFDNPDQRREPGAGVGDPLSQFVSGDGKAMGIDFLVKYEGTFFSSWLAYSLSKATRRFNEINRGADIPADYDQTNEFKWTNIYSLRKWNFSTLTIFTTGKPYVVSSLKDENFNTTRVYGRLPGYFRTDVSVNYNFNIKNVNIKPGVSILNAFDTDNYLDVYTRVFDLGEVSPFNETTLIKAQSLTFNFFVNFRF
ncbi:TonB-dependent receptor plug domain-containing protein [Maribellus sp. YY47]|uniref:TonB-dependent receptor plug domain-containing protein n=1 Tax=Maribellus sp. YY47 TaxID=2929486 RepID=UPI002000DC3D|nr:TonB-dependent receptor plug domain-containing protein [Maribellus sp. YY47]MCK3685872.1 TonB-dependent receptor plug domain-containing protein [Maribellus sp. YY47]